jgi:hypothetical protein
VACSDCAAGKFAVSSAASCTDCQAGKFLADVSSVPVTWMPGAVNVVASTGAVVKNGGNYGDWDAGAWSTQAISSSSTQSQGITFRCSSTAQLVVGLSTTDIDVSLPKNIQFALMCRKDGSLRVYESGARKYESGAYIATDSLEVRITGGGTTVEDLQNGVVFYTTSDSVPTFPLHVDTSFQYM